MDNKSYNIRVPKRWVRIAMIVGVTALIVAPLTAVATHSFDDVPGSHTFHEDIEWMKAADVTKGCNPPANTRYCPNDNVTRAQMAAFMKRFAGYLGAEDGTPAQADHADTADNADTVGGITPDEIVTHGEIVTTVGGGTWIPNSNFSPTTLTYLAGTTLVGGGGVELDLQGPSMIGGVDYGLQSLTYCIGEITGGAFVTAAQVYRGSSNFVTPVASDATDRTVAGCYTLDVGHSGDTYSVFVQVSGTSLRVGGIEARWLPASQLTSTASPQQDDGGAAAGG